MKARFVVGPPGTGKTHTFLVEKYEECFSKYNPEKIVLLSHTNVAVGQILDAIMELKEVKEKRIQKKIFEDRICTIHHYCKSKLLKKKSLKIRILKTCVEKKQVFVTAKKEMLKNILFLNLLKKHEVMEEL